MYNDIESLYKAGKIPDIYYYQLNGKTAQENYFSQKEKIYQDIKKKNDDNFIIALVEKLLQSAVDEALKEILKPLTK